MATLLKAAPLAHKICEDLKREYANIKKTLHITPHLKVILVGEHPPSLIYTRNKKKLIEDIGGKCDIVKLPHNLSEEELLIHVKKLNADKEVHGVLIQLPLPSHLAHIDVGELIPPSKDVDGFHPENLYKILSGNTQRDALVSCTSKGIITMLKNASVELEGKNVVIIGRSLIVGKPLSMLMTNHHATVTLCHSRTKNLKKICQRADILVSAIGKAKFINSEFISSHCDQIIIDVGINHDEEGHLCGDVDFADVYKKCKMISPVPGGVGKMTIVSLGQNLLQAAYQLNSPAFKK